LKIFQPVNTDEVRDNPLWRRLPHLAAFAVAALVYAASGLDWVEYKLMDLRFQLAERPVSGDTVLIGIDSRSLRELDKWPWPRGYHAELIDRLDAAGVKRIALDIDLSSASTQAADKALEDALMRANGKVILPVFKQFSRADGGALVYTEPLEAFRRHTQTAAVNVRPERESLVRRYARVETWRTTYIPSLATQMSGQLPSAFDQFFVDYSFVPDSVPYLSYVDILKGRFSADALAGKTVIVGATAVELGDMLAVPVYSALPGALLQVLAHESLKLNRAIQRSHPAWSYVLGLALALFLGPSIANLTWGRGLTAAGALTAVGFGATMWLQSRAPLSLDTALPGSVVWLSYFWGLARRIDLQSVRIFKQHMAAVHRRALMSSIVQSCFEGIVLTNADGRIEFANPAACRLLDLTDDQLAGGNIHEYLDPAPVKDTKTGLIEGETDSRVLARSARATMTAANGREIPVEISVSVAQLAPGNDPVERRTRARLVLIYTIRDIRDRIQAEAALRNAADRALAADRAKSELLANVSHELRTPLNAIIGFSQVMQQQLFGPLGSDKYQAYTDDILYSGEHLLDLVNNLLSISRLDSGEYELDDESLNLPEIATACAKIVKGNLKGKTVAIDVDMPVETPRLRGDSQAVRQILLNLIGNAVKFTPDSGTVRVAAEVADDGRLALIVADNGIGIGKADLPHIMEPFRQVEGAHSRHHGGIGLGLHIVRRLVDLHNGEIRIESELGAGTRVTILFPRARIHGGNNVVTLPDRQARQEGRKET